MHLASPIVIIGNKGLMGSMLHTRLMAAGYTNIFGIDREIGQDTALAFQDATLQKIVPQGELVIICVPVTVLPTVLSKVAPFMCKEQLLMDITSVKVLPMQWMAEAFAGPIVGTHPLFGPKPEPEDMRVAITPGSRASEEQCRLIEAMYQNMGCTTFRTDPESHDTGVGFAQSLNFAMTAAFFATLARHKGIRPFLTPSFKRLMQAARKHLTQDTAMFCEFTAANPCFEHVINTYTKNLEEAAKDNLAGIATEAAVWYAEGTEDPTLE